MNRQFLFTIAAAVLGASCTSGTRGAISGQSPATAPQPLAPGLTWWRTSDARGPWSMSIVRIDLTERALALRAVHAFDSLAGRERVSSMVARAAATSSNATRVRVAINADFFDLRNGQSENNQVTDGEWWVGRMLTDSPYDTWDNVHSQLALTHDGRASIARYVPDARVWVRGEAMPLLGVNHAASGTFEGTMLYTPRYGARTPRDTVRVDSSAQATARRVAEVSLQRLGTRGDTVLYRVLHDAGPAWGADIPHDGAVVAAHGDRVPALQRWKDGDTARVWIGTSPALADGRPPAQLIGGWPQILAAGVNIADQAARREGTISRNAEARHPRSAVGLSRDGRTMWLFVVDGRSERSVGMTLVELGDAMRALGAWDALNFDGGGSTTLVIDGRVVNIPTDATGERAVGNALLIMQRQ